MTLGLSVPILEKQDPLNKEMKEIADEVRGSFEKNYQKWYTEAHAVIRQLIPDRLVEFEQLYKGDGKRRGIDSITYNIQDWLNGVRAREDQYSRLVEWSQSKRGPVFRKGV
jgi:hypothetical protein